MYYREREKTKVRINHHRFKKMRFGGKSFKGKNKIIINEVIFSSYNFWSSWGKDIKFWKKKFPKLLFKWGE